MKPLLWLRYSECVLAVGFHPERLQTKHWEIAAARWEQNSNKWRPGKREDESFMAVWLSYCSEPAHLQSKLKADEPAQHPGLCCSSPGRWERVHQPPSPGKDWLFSPGGAGRISAHWTSPCPHKTGFYFVLWLRNQSVGRSIDSWQQSSSFLKNIIPLPVLSVLES